MGTATCGSRWDAWLFGRSISRLSRLLRSVLRTYIKDIKILFRTSSDHHLPTSIPTLWIANSELSSPFCPPGSAVCRAGSSGSQWSAWLFGCLFSRLSRPRRCLFLPIFTTKETLFCTPSNHHLPTSFPTLWIAYSELNSPSRPAVGILLYRNLR